MDSAETAAMTISTHRIYQHIRQLEGIRHPTSDWTALNAAADYIRLQLKESDIEVSEHQFDLTGFVGTFRNVEGVINKRKADKEWVISAHYDTVCDSPGADDNASGVSVMLEAARVLAKSGTERTIRFVGFSLEEGSPVAQGKRLVGSCKWAACAKQRPSALGGVINLESVGYATSRSGFQSYPAHFDPGLLCGHRFDQNRADFIAILSDRASTRLGQVCFNQCRSSLVDIPALLAAVPLTVSEIREQYPDMLRADHTSFWKQGFQAITLTDTAELRTPYYHTAEDTKDKLDLGFVRKVCMATVLTALRA